MNTVYVLIMLWSTPDYRGGMTTIQQEFNSVETCERARVVLQRANKDIANVTMLRASGCFKK